MFSRRPGPRSQSFLNSWHLKKPLLRWLITFLGSHQAGVYSPIGPLDVSSGGFVDQVLEALALLIGAMVTQIDEK